MSLLMKIACSLLICWFFLSSSLMAQQTVVFKNGHIGKASVVLFKTKTVLIKSFDNPRAPIQEVPKNSIEQIVMADGTALTSIDIALRQSPADQIALFVKQESSRVATDDGSARPVAYEWSNFLDKSITLVSVKHTQETTMLTFLRRNTGSTQFILSSATYLYNRQDIRQAFRLVNAGKFDLDVPITIPSGIDSLYLTMSFERVSPGLEEVNFKSMPIAAGALGGPVGGYLITRIPMNAVGMANRLDEASVATIPFGAAKINCITCGGIGTVRCPNCAGEGTVTTTKRIPVVRSTSTDYQITSQRIVCPVCHGNRNYLCPNRPNHPQLP